MCFQNRWSIFVIILTQHFTQGFYTQQLSIAREYQVSLYANYYKWVITNSVKCLKAPKNITDNLQYSLHCVLISMPLGNFYCSVWHFCVIIKMILYFSRAFYSSRLIAISTDTISVINGFFKCYMSEKDNTYTKMPCSK